MNGWWLTKKIIIQNKNHWLMRWGLMLQGYDLSIKHIKCKDSFIANFLSRVG
jgi:hypothetical protein